jgi:hypothetical protein
MAALVFSGCFTFAGINWSALKLRPGDKTVATVFTRPAGKTTGFPSPSHRDYVFFWVGLPLDSSSQPALQLLSQGRRFDVTKKFGNHPRKLVSDNQLRDYFVNNGECGDFPTDSDHAYRVVRTVSEVFDKRKPGARAVSKLPFKQVSLLDPNFFNQGIVTVAAGFWNDDGDGVPESSDDDLGCEGGAESFLFMKGSSAKVNKQQARQHARQYNLDG